MTMRVDKYLFSAPFSILDFMKTLTSALASRIKLRCQKHQQYDQKSNTIDFYLNTRFKEKAENVVDGADDHYFEYASSNIDLSQSILGESHLLLDLGCGQAKAARLIRGCSKFNKYLGIDLVIFNETRKLYQAVETTFIEHDISTFEYSDIELTNALGVLLNSLCYLSDRDLNRLLKNLKVSSLNKLVIIDPHPGFNWEIFFDGIKINLRNPKLLANRLSKHGFDIKAMSILYRFRIFGIYFWRISYALTLSKSQK